MILHFVVQKVLKIARAVGECNLRTFKTSQVTINSEMHKQVHTFSIYFLIYSPKLLIRSSSSSCLCSYSSIFGFTFLSVVYLCQTFNQVCVAFNMCMFLFSFSLSWSTMFWFDKANWLLPFFLFWCSNLALPLCFHGNFRIALYNHLFVLSLTQSSLCPWAHKAATRDYHCFRFFAFFVSSSQLTLFARISFSTVRHQVSFGLPHALFPDGDQCIATLGIVDGSILRTCPIQHHLPFFTSKLMMLVIKVTSFLWLKNLVSVNCCFIGCLHRGCPNSEHLSSGSGLFHPGQ